jgi:cardiolipin synthase A/B
LSRAVFRRAALATAAAATAVLPLAVIPGSQAATGSYTLFTLPSDGHSAVYNFIGSATSTLDMTMYELTDTTAEQDLAAAAARGVTVKVILDGAQKPKNTSAFNFLKSNGVSVVWSSTRFTFTHEKSLVADGNRALILTGNLDSTFYSSDRDYGVVDTDPTDAAAIQAVFNADFKNSAITPSDGDDLVWSPTDSQSHLLSLINGAHTSLLVEEEEFGDTTLVNALVAAAKRGVSVKVVAENESGYHSNFTAVKNAGGQVSTYSTSGSFYVHAKAIVADGGTSAAKVFLGSENFSDTSLNSNRELGLIINDTSIISSVGSTITADFTNGTRF